MKRKFITCIMLLLSLSLLISAYSGCESTPGENGKSAYEIAVDNGFSGTQKEWLDSLNGAPGADGAQGDKGDTGDTGKGVKRMWLDEELHLWVEYDDGTPPVDLGYVGVETQPSAPTTYTVEFVDYNGTVLKTETVEKGADATAPVAPTRNGYLFSGWDKTFDNVVTNLTVTATYTQIIEPTIVISSASGKAGDEVEIIFDLSKSPELYAMCLKIVFDESSLELVSAKSGEAMENFTYTAPSRLKNGATFMWYANEASEANGTVLKLVFKIKNNATVGELPISMTCDSNNTYDANDNDIELDFVDGSITVTE